LWVEAKIHIYDILHRSFNVVKEENRVDQVFSIEIPDKIAVLVVKDKDKAIGPDAAEHTIVR
jgi:protein-tyrosine phosphatase